MPFIDGMSPVKILEQEKSSRLETRVHEDDGRSAIHSHPKHFTKAAIEALVQLGYPIGRDLSSAQSADDFAGGLPKIYARMKITFYQNRNEFLRLKPILQSR
jgi:hypothetical protein